MECRLTELFSKEVIHIEKGVRIGFVDDVVIDIKCREIKAIVVYGRSKCFGLFGKEDDIVILWEQIEVIGKDTLLVNCSYSFCKKKPLNLFGKIFK